MHHFRRSPSLERTKRTGIVSEKKTTKPPETESRSIESAMERLEKLIDEMEGDALPLEKLITRYEEGVTLVRLCQEKLDAAEQKIQLITRKASGPDGLVNFVTDPDES